MSNFEKNLEVKKNDLYSRLATLWYGEAKNVWYDGFEKILGYMHYKPETHASILADPKLMSCIAKIQKLRLQSNYKMEELWDLVSDTSIYRAVELSGINVGFFAASLNLYVWTHGGFVLQQFYSLCPQWHGSTDADLSQQMFNSAIRATIDRLSIFYG